MRQKNNVRLETPGLYLVPLDYNQLLMCAQFDGSLESAMKMTHLKEQCDPILKITLEKFMIPYVASHPEYILYGTIWILKAQNVIVGNIGFKGAPSDKGLLEIGYSMNPEFRNRGLMTEALSAMTQWAFNQPEVHIILAEVNKDNFPSQRVLEKNRFEPFAETESVYWWRLDR